MIIAKWRMRSRSSSSRLTVEVVSSRLLSYHLVHAEDVADLKGNVNVKPHLKFIAVNNEGQRCKLILKVIFNEHLVIPWHWKHILSTLFVNYNASKNVNKLITRAWPVLHNADSSNRRSVFKSRCKMRLKVFWLLVLINACALQKLHYEFEELSLHCVFEQMSDRWVNQLTFIDLRL